MSVLSCMKFSQFVYQFSDIGFTCLVWRWVVEYGEFIDLSSRVVFALYLEKSAIDYDLSIQNVIIFMQQRDNASISICWSRGCVYEAVV